MKRKLRCSDPSCESHSTGQHLFSISTTVDEDRDLAENLSKVESEHFSCAFCGSQAEERGED